MAEEKNEVNRIKFLFVGVNSYAKYLRSHLNFDIDSAKLYPKIMVLVSKERKELINSICEAFSEDIDKLKPISCLAAFLKVPVEQILVKESK